jgi:glycosyltransferase involved in cell wall biosynthesis
MRLTLITCFHNSTIRLDRYFGSLSAVDVRGINLDVVLVDNASTDQTHRCLLEIASQLAFPCLVLEEKQPGLMHARCTAIDAATGEFVLFLDDDNELRPDYLQELHRLVRKYPEATFYCGNSLPPAEYDVSQEIKRVAGVVAIREEAGEFQFRLSGAHHPNGPWGAGLCGRRVPLAEACRAWKQTDQTIAGRTGTGLSGGEDHWMVHHACRNNSNIAFSDRLVLCHRISPARLQPEHLAKVIFQAGYDWPGHLGAFKRLRPDLPENCPEGLRLLAFLVVQIPRAAVALFIRRDFVSVMTLCHRLGLGMRLALLHWRRGPRYHPKSA